MHVTVIFVSIVSGNQRVSISIVLGVFKGQVFHGVGVQGSGFPLLEVFKGQVFHCVGVFKCQDFHCVTGIQGSGFPLCERSGFPMC